MTQNFASWMWVLAVFPLWLVMAWLWFSLAYVPKKAAGPRMRNLLDIMAVSLSMCSAMGILVGLNCGSLISLPFGDQACHVSMIQLAWVGSDLNLNRGAIGKTTQLLAHRDARASGSDRE